MSNTFTTRLSAILLLVVAILLYLLWHTSNKKDHIIDQQSNLITALNDTLKITRFADSSSKAYIQAFTTVRAEDFLAMRVKDSTIEALQELVAKNKKQLKNGGSATIIKTETTIASSGPTIIEHTNYDTLYKPVFPTYKSVITERNGWYTIKTTADKDTTRVNLTIKNAYDVVLGKEDGKWFANVTSYNPYSSIKTMRAYNVEVPKMKQKRVNIIIFGGYGLNLQGEVRSGPLIGAGVGYTILSLF